MDLRSHAETWMKARCGDRHVGFSPAALTAMVRDAGLTDLRVTTGPRRTASPFAVLIASGTRR
jgi:hypothetical protein